MDVSRIIQEGEYARSLRQSWDPLFQECADYEAPQFADFSVQFSPGQKRGQKIVNSIGVESNNEAAARVDSFLTGDGTTWLDLRIDNDRMEKNPATRAWLDQCLKMGFSVFNDPKSGFAVAKQQMYSQIMCVGTGPVFVGETANGLPYFMGEFLGRLSFWCDDMGSVIAAARHYDDTAWQLIQRFGREGMPQEVLSAMEKEPQRKFKCLHMIRPWMDGDPYNIVGFPFIEYYILIDKLHMLRQPRGYNEMPWMVPRWDVSPGEIYGRSPGMNALPDVLQLQRMGKDAAKIIQKHSDPGWIAEDDGSSQPRINTAPGGISFGRMTQTGHFSVQQLPPYGDPVAITEREARLEQKVKNHYYLNAFKLFDKISPDGAVVHSSATEAAMRQAEQLRVAGPLLVRLRAEFLFPVVTRVFRILGRNGWLPVPPAQMRGMRVFPEYVSPLAIAQKGHARQAILQTLGDVLPLAQVDQRVLLEFNSGRTVRAIATANHAPQEIFNTDAEKSAMAQALMEAQSQQAQAEQLGTTARASLDSAKAVATLRGTAA